MNSLITHQRYPFDDFTFDLFNKIVNLIDINGLFIYMHHWGIQHAKEELLNLINNATEQIIVLGIKDHYIYAMDNFFSELSFNNPTKKFLLIVSHENLGNRILKDKPNILNVLSWGGDLTNQVKFYQLGDVPIHKSFDDFIFTCHMRSPTKDRQILLSLILGFEIEKYGLITARDWFNSGGGGYTAKFFSEIYTPNETIYKILDNGSLMANSVKPNIIYDPKFENDVFKPGNPPLNFENFRKYLRPNYERAPIDIVAESEMTNDAPFLTEKTLHAFYGKSLPIVITGTGAIQHLRDVGFDVFDDVIDHSYDVIDDRLLRIYSAVHKNLHLLTNKEFIFKKYNSIDPSRFDHNVNIIKNHLCNFYENRLINDYTKVIEQYIEKK